MSHKKWIVTGYQKEIANSFYHSGQFSQLLSILLAGRGFESQEDALEYINCENFFTDPFVLKDMQKAVDRIEQAIANFEKIAIYGDYDADGVTATAVLYSYLTTREANVMYEIPERDGEGYGLHPDSITQLKEDGVTLIVTVDNGISALAEIEYAQTLGVDVVVTDHHTPGEVLPKAVAVVNPHREDNHDGYKYLAGVGVALKLVQALEGGDPEGLLEQYADIVTIGTIGDVVPLTGENRAVVQQGLLYLEHSERPGINALIEISGAASRKMSSRTVAYSLVPRINAAGRMGSPKRAVKLLLTEHEEEAMDIAREIEDENKKRQVIEAEILAEAEKIIAEDGALAASKLLLIYGYGWHRGVIGIVATRICEKYGKPCIMVSVDGNDVKGSGRSLPGFSLYNAIKACSPYLTRFGGHTLAAGLNTTADQLENLRKAMTAYTDTLEEDMPVPILRLDCKLKPSSIMPDTIADLHYLEPFGSANAIPVYGIYNMKIESITPLAGGKHLRLNLKMDQKTLPVLCFNTQAFEFQYKPGDVVDAAVVLEPNEYKGEQGISIILKELRPSGFDDDQYILARRLVDQIKRMEHIEAARLLDAIPTRDDIAEIFRFIRSGGGYIGNLDVFYFRLGRIDFDKIGIALEILKDIGVIGLEVRGEYAVIRVTPTENKVDLEQSWMMMTIKNRIQGDEKNAC